MSLANFLQELNRALDENGGDSAVLLLENELRTFNNTKNVNPNNPQAIENAVSRAISDGEKSHRPFVTDFIKAVVDSRAHRHLMAFDELDQAMKSFLETSFVKGAIWTIPIIKLMAIYLRIYAGNAEKQKGTKPTASTEDKKKVTERDPLGDCARTLMDVFRKAVSDKSELPQSRKWVLLDVINSLFRIYFRINQLRLCKNLIQPVESGQNFPPFDSFSSAQRVTYKYYAGRFAMYESDFMEAQKRLEYAFHHCHKDYADNKRKILTYLISVNLVLGKAPSPRLLRKYNMDSFVQLVDGYRKGDLRQFQASLDQYQDLFIRKGIYLIIDKAKIVVYRNLCKRM